MPEGSSAAFAVGPRGRPVGRSEDSVGPLGTWILVTRAEDGHLVETDEQYAVMIGTFGRRDPAVPRRRSWCRPDHHAVVSGPAWMGRRFPVWVDDRPRDLRAARAGVSATR